MRARGIEAQPTTRRRRRWPRVLGAIAALSIVGIIVVLHYLQPAQLTALILARAGSALHLELRTTGPGSYALRPEPRLVLPGLSAKIPGASAPFFRSGQVELALPWSTLRGRSADISSIVLKSPDLNLPAMETWLATIPTSNAPFKFPRLTSGLQISDGTLRGTHWRIEHADVALPALADGKPMSLDASGNLVRDAIVSRFALTMAATPAGVSQGLRIDGAHIIFTSDGELPSLTANGSLLAADHFAVDFAGVIQRMPSNWSAAIDTSFANPGDTPFSIILDDGAPAPTATNAIQIATAQQTLRLKLMLGDSKRQPALTLKGEASNGVVLKATLHGQLSRWPDAWPGLSPILASNAAPIVFDANYQGSFFLSAPIAIDVKRADTSLQGRVRIADVRAWIKRKFDTPLPPIEATLSTPQIDVGGMQLRGVRINIRDDAVAPVQSATTPATPPKS